MAEEKVMSQALVLDGFSEKLRNMQLNNLTAKQQSKLKNHRQQFILHFLSLSYSFFGLSPNQIKELSETEIKELDKLISRKALPWMIYQIIFTFCVPIFGWIGGPMFGLDVDDGGYKSWLYLRHKKRLVDNLGKDYFPFQELEQKLG